MKILLSELERAVAHLKTDSNDLFPVIRILNDHLELSYVNKEGEASSVIIYDEKTQLPPKITTFARLK